MPLELLGNSVSARPPGLVAKDQDPEPGVRPQPNTISVNGNHVEAVSDFIYLGSSQSSDGQSRPDIRRRTGLASAVMSSLNNIWKGKRLSLSIKLRVYLALVQSVLLYASETWSLTVADSKSLDAFRMKCQRRILGISWHQFVRNARTRLPLVPVSLLYRPPSVAVSQPSSDT